MEFIEIICSFLPFSVIRINMFRKVFLYFAIFQSFLLAASFSEDQTAENKNFILGTWISSLETQGTKTSNLDLVVTLDEKNRLISRCSLKEHGIKDLPLDLVLTKNSLRFENESLGLHFDGCFNELKNEITGTFYQNENNHTLTLKKRSKLFRPQEPKAPYPYRVENIQYENTFAKVTLAGTLTCPLTDKKCPAVLLIAGSGPNDRDETVFGHKPFFLLADYLTRNGIVVLRVDKRGVASSTGHYESATGLDFADDVQAGVEYLKNRSEVNSKQIGLIGHSEGGLIAPMVASKSKDVAFIILMAGPAITGEELLYEQTQAILQAKGVGLSEREMQRNLQEKLFSIIKEEDDPRIAEIELRKVLERYLNEFPNEKRNALRVIYETQIDRINSNWFRYFLTYDPKTALKQIKIPFLALNGELDLQVSSKQNLPLIAKALKKACNKDYQVIEFPKVNHLFQTALTGSIEEYSQIEETLSPLVLKTISDWICERFKASSETSK
ncbi:Conserved hypothetical protein [Criblamydia sequanensis CRIB-18]|uniref:Xaa-Pro dipeptidyl-peptidase-like domain-containing protein n=2 Tax=Candidatus Criblamydia sequanensis TaxID=340071 RepID=A0A090CYE1_9BACT|nr:Conserved hypothetical protein [Criblamydia sequanensis CRIB-18]